MGGMFLGLSLIFNSNPTWSWFAAIGFALTFADGEFGDWLGESWVRASRLDLSFLSLWLFEKFDSPG